MARRPDFEPFHGARNRGLSGYFFLLTSFIAEYLPKANKEIRSVSNTLRACTCVSRVRARSVVFDAYIIGFLLFFLESISLHL